jgi:hypothetical protein
MSPPRQSNVLKTLVGALREVRGAFTAAAVDAAAGAIELSVPAAGELTLVFDGAVQLEPATTVGMVQPTRPRTRHLAASTVRAAGTASLRYDVRSAATAIAA